MQNIAYIDWYHSGLPNIDGEGGDVVTGGATSSLFHSFTPHFSGTAAVGVYATDQEEVDTFVTGQLLVGARYQF